MVCSVLSLNLFKRKIYLIDSGFEVDSNDLICFTDRNYHSYVEMLAFRIVSFLSKLRSLNSWENDEAVL